MPFFIRFFNAFEELRVWKEEDLFDNDSIPTEFIFLKKPSFYIFQAKNSYNSLGACCLAAM